MREDVSFRTSDGLTLRGWYYKPAGKGPWPLVVMAHGFSAVKEMGLDDFAEVFAAAGIASLAYDNRCFGASDGTPRFEADPWLQLRDYRDAITFGETLAGVDPERIGVWGSSYSGGHVLAVSALDRRVKAVVSQAPLISGLSRIREATAEQLAFEHQDRRARFAGAVGAVVPATSPPTDVSVLADQSAWDWFSGLAAAKAPAWRNEVTVRSIEHLRAYDPGAYIPYISPTPWLLIVALEDSITPAAPAIEAFERAEGPKQLLTVPGGHFDVYNVEFPGCSAAARDWFAKHL